MKLSHDNSSWHASGIIARDERATKDQNEEPKHRAKKDKRKWCKGQVGVHHRGKWKTETTPVPWRKNYRELVCERCSKRLDYCYSFMGDRCRAPNHGHEVK